MMPHRRAEAYRIRRAGRRLDWGLCLLQALWGVYVLILPEAMAGSAFVALRDIAAAPVWGGAMLTAGAAHAAALMVNGGSGWTPPIRAAVNLGCALIYMTIAAGFASAGPTTGVPTYAALSALHATCAAWAFADASDGPARRWVRWWRGEQHG